MKKQLIILLVSAMATPLLAQQAPPPERSEKTEQQRRQYQGKKYQFSDKALTRIGVSEEDKIKIHALQAEHRKKIETNKKRMGIAHTKLSWLQDVGESEAEIDAAIQEIADAQTEQLKILVYNRREMEKILGKEKYAQIMEIARVQFRQHARRAGPGLPPRPDLPPMPKQESGAKKPPPPDVQGDQIPPPPTEN